MKKSFVIVAAMATAVIMTTGFAEAQQYAFIDLVGDSAGGVQPSRFQFGTMVGRDGAAFGPGVLAQVNLGYIGLYGFAGTSSVSDYQEQGATANFNDRTVGFGIVGRLISVRRRFTFGFFTQASYYGSHTVATYPDGMGGTLQYRDSDKDPMVTLGPDIEYQVPRSGISVFIRPGHDFGDSIAANTANGFSINAGILISPRDIGGGFKRVKGLFR